MAASSALTMTAACAVLVILLSQPAMALLPGEQLIPLGGGLAYSSLTGLLFFLPTEAKCTEDQGLCILACKPTCKAFGEQILCNKIICNQAIYSCFENVDYTCNDVCAKLCGALKPKGN